MMEDPQLLARLATMDDRLANLEVSTTKCNRDIGKLVGKVLNGRNTMLIKYVVFPLILIVGGLLGIKFTLPVLPL